GSSFDQIPESLHRRYSQRSDPPVSGTIQTALRNTPYGLYPAYPVRIDSILPCFKPPGHPYPMEYRPRWLSLIPGGERLHAFCRFRDAGMGGVTCPQGQEGMIRDRHRGL